FQKGYPNQEEKSMTKRSRTHVVPQPAKDDAFVGVISPLKLHLKTRRQAVRPGQIIKSGKERSHDRIALKRDLRERFSNKEDN
ncbi:MAG: hypothetical protein AAB879_03200, partial [Patescibacteria group bacterium]